MKLVIGMTFFVLLVSTTVYAQVVAPAAPGLSPEEIHAQSLQAAQALAKLSPLPNPDLTMCCIKVHRQGNSIVFCGEVLGRDFPVRTADYVRFIAEDGVALIEYPLGPYMVRETFARDWASYCEP